MKLETAASPNLGPAWKLHVLTCKKLAQVVAVLLAVFVSAEKVANDQAWGLALSLHDG